jgi:hypothetical protein
MSANRPTLDQREFANLIEAAGFYEVRRENLSFGTQPAAPSTDRSPS